MNQKLLRAAVTIAFVACSVAPAFADQGGCPNVASDNGALHANAHSAHGTDKQVARGCGEVTPPPVDCTLNPTDPACQIGG